MIDWLKVVQDLKEDIQSRKQNMRNAQRYIKELEKENAHLKKDAEQFQMALREQVELNKTLIKEDVKTVVYLPTTAYLEGLAEGKRNMREFGIKVCLAYCRWSRGERSINLSNQERREAAVDEVMKNG